MKQAQLTKRKELEYNSLKKIPHYKECNAVAEAEGFRLVELQIVPQKNSVKITAVIAPKDASKDVGVADCSKVHRVLQAKLISLINRPEDEIFMEVCSPGIERNLKNAAEFELFKGREVRVWDKTVNDWVRGFILDSDENQVVLKQEENQVSVLYENIAKAKFIHL